MSLDFDGVYGATSGPWTTDMFVEAAYREIKANTAPWKARLLRNVPADELPFIAASNTADAARAKNRRRRRPRRGSSDPLEGKWVLNLFVSSYEPSSLMPYRREMTVTVNGDEMTTRSLSWRRPQGNGSPLSTYGYNGQTRWQGIPDSELGRRQGHAEAP